MERIYTLLILSLIGFNFTFSQPGDTSPLQGKLLLSFNGGVTIAKTDYANTIPSVIGIGAAEYYFDIKSKNTLGIRFYGGLGTVRGSDDNRIPDKFSDEIIFFGGGLLYGYAINNQFVPYLFLGASNQWYNPKGNNDSVIIKSKPASVSLSGIAYNYEVGVKIFLGKSSTLNISGGEFISLADDLDGIKAGNQNDVICYGTIGISVAFWGKTDSDGDGIRDSEDACPDTPAGVEVNLYGCPVDSDNDGVPDYLDDCPQTPSGVRVDTSGCPVDSDNDGIPDYIDNCPDSPPGVPVDSLGCIKDSDNDSVPDYLDNCPDTPAGVKVDSTGCPDDMNHGRINENQETKFPIGVSTVSATDTMDVEQQAKSSEYDLDKEYLVKNMIFTDGTLFTAQISSWKTKWKAESIAEKLRNEGYDTFVREFFVEKVNENWYQVRVGYFKTFRAAQKVAEDLR